MKLRAPDHKGMLVDYRGMLRQAREQLRRVDDGEGMLNAEMLRQLTDHLNELGERFYVGDTAVVDEFLQLYCIARDKRSTPVPVDTEAVIQQLAEELPEGYEVILHVERHAGWVELAPPDSPVTYTVTDDTSHIGERLLAALKHAKEGTEP